MTANTPTDAPTDAPVEQVKRVTAAVRYGNRLQVVRASVRNGAFGGSIRNVKQLYDKTRRVERFDAIVKSRKIKDDWHWMAIRRKLVGD